MAVYSDTIGPEQYRVVATNHAFGGASLSLHSAPFTSRQAQTTRRIEACFGDLRVASAKARLLIRCHRMPAATYYLLEAALRGKYVAVTASLSDLQEIAMLRAKFFGVVTSALAIGAALSTHAADTTTVYASKDARITADVRGAIAEHPDLRPPNEIYVQTRHQVVYLSGIVFTGLSAANAEDVARHVPGVARVVSDISVEE